MACRARQCPGPGCASSVPSLPEVVGRAPRAAIAPDRETARDTPSEATGAVPQALSWRELLVLVPAHKRQSAAAAVNLDAADQRA